MNYSQMYKSLDDIGKWKVVDEGLAIERYVHVDGYTCFSHCCFSMFYLNENFHVFCDRSHLHFLTYIFTFKEYRFRKALKKVGILHA